MIGNLSAEELADRLDSAGKTLCRAAGHFRNGAIPPHELEKISAGFQRHIAGFIDALHRMSDRAAASPAGKMPPAG